MARAAVVAPGLFEAPEDVFHLDYTRPEFYPKQFDAIFDKRRFSLIEASTKSGKTAGCVAWLIERALMGDSGQNFWWVAPVSDQALIAFRRSMRALPQDVYTPNISLKTMTLINGAVIWFKSGDKPNCYDDQTEILTQRGWRLFRDLDALDVVMTRSTSGAAEWQAPTRITAASYAGEMVTIANKRIDLVVTPNHRMVIGRRLGQSARGKWDRGAARTGPTSTIKERIVLAEELRPKDTIPSWATWAGTDHNDITVDRCALLGFYLAEGSAIWNSSDNPHQRVKRSGYRVFFAQTGGIKGGDKGNVREQFCALLDRLGYRYKQKRDGIMLWDKSLWSEFIGLGNKYSKYIPARVKELPVAKLRALLKWMIAGDGSSRRGEQWTYFTVSKRLAGDVQEIAIKCGWNATIKERAPQPFVRSPAALVQSPGVTGYIVKIQKTGKQHHLSGGGKSYVGRTAYNGTVYCVSVPNGVVLVRRNGKPIWAGNSLYGEDVYGVVIDEASRMKEDAYIAIRSTVTYTRAPIRIIGNVRGRKNWFFKMARRAEHGDPEMGYHKIVAADAVAAGVLDAKEIEDARTQMPEQAWRELYLAEPSDDGGNPFGLQYIRKCIVPTMSTALPRVWGWDLAKRQDYTVGIALDQAGYVCRFVRLQGIPWPDIITRIKVETGKTPALVDSTGLGDPVLDQLQREAGANFEGFHFHPASKQKLMEGLAVAIQGSHVTYPDGPIVLELEQFEYQVTRTSVKYSAPEGYHDDCVCALALAVQHFHAAPVPMNITQEMVQQIMRSGRRH